MPEPARTLGPFTVGAILFFGLPLPGTLMASVTSFGAREVGCLSRAPGTMVATSLPAGMLGASSAKRAMGAASAFARRT